MKYRDILHLIPVLVVILLLSFTFLAQTTEFTYQGYLNDSSQPANGSYDFEFALYDSVSGGTQLGSTISVSGVVVSDGAFSVRLDFGSEFPGANRFLEIRVQQSASSVNKDLIPAFTTLTPRQPVTSAPYAVKSLNATNAANAANAVNATTATNATQLGGVAASQFVLTSDTRLSDARTPTSGSGNYIQNTTIQQSSSDFNISGTGKAAIFDVTTQFNLGGNRVLSVAGDNLFAGGGAGDRNTTGLFNSFFGTSAGYLNTTGGGNSFFGRSSGHFNTTGFDNSFFGRTAGFSNTTGGRNSFFGRSAGYSNTTGFANSFFGWNAGHDNTTGVANSFFGTSAGRTNTTGYSNSFFGWNAGHDNTTGFDNSFFGRTAGFSNTTGGGNSFFGRSAGYSNTTGNSNSFFGRSAGYDNTTGFDNSFFGNDAGYSNTTGNSNSFFGRGAGSTNTTGYVNSFFGKDAGKANTTGSHNSFFGWSAGQLNTTGIHNTFMGLNAGDRNTTGSDNTVIGVSADVGVENLNFATAIGAGAIVSASNTIQLGRSGSDTVRIGKLGSGASTPLCLSTGKAISTCSSSIRYKSNIEDFHPGLSLIRRLRPVSFNWKDGGMPDVGLVAEEVKEIEPLLTTRNQDGQIEGVKYDRVSIVLVNAVKEQQKIIESQQKQIDALKALVCSNNKAAEICKDEYRKQ